MVADTPPTEGAPETGEAEPIDILRFLRENRPSLEEARSPKEIRLIEPLRRKLREHEGDLQTAGVAGDNLERLLGKYASELEKTLQDPRPYVDLGNRAYANGRMLEEVIGIIPTDRDLTLEDLGRVVRLDLDMDEFKTLNDYYGHRAGDEVLETLATVLKDGDAVKWIKEQDVLETRDKGKPTSIEFTAEGGEEFGGLLVFKEGVAEKKQGKILEEFKSRLQAETTAKFKEVLTQTKDGELRFLRLQEPPEGVMLPEGFIMESGLSFGSCSAREAAEYVEIDEQRTSFGEAVGKIRSQLYKVSDGKAMENKETRKSERWDTGEGSDARATAEISPRGRVDLLEKEKRDLIEARETLEERIEKLAAEKEGLQVELTKCQQGL